MYYTFIYIYIYICTFPQTKTDHQNTAGVAVRGAGPSRDAAPSRGGARSRGGGAPSRAAEGVAGDGPGGEAVK